MRPSSALLPTAAALLVLTACGGGSDDATSAPGSAAGSSTAAPSSSAAAPSSSGGADVAAFCTQAGSVLTELNSAFQGASEPTQLPALLDQASVSLQAVEPPAEIADSWAGFSGAIGQLAEASRQVDLSTAEGQARFSEQYATLTSQATADQEAVDQYVTANCPEIEVGPAG